MNEVAYCAGVLDSDGSISIIQHYTQGNDIYLVMSVSQMTTRALGLFQRLFGGFISHERGGLWRWQVSHKKALAAIGQLKPYLRVKQMQAWLAQEFIAQRGAGATGGRGLSEEDLALRQGYALAMQTANRDAL